MEQKLINCINKFNMDIYIIYINIYFGICIYLCMCMFIYAYTYKYTHIHTMHIHKCIKISVIVQEICYKIWKSLGKGRSKKNWRVGIETKFWKSGKYSNIFRKLLRFFFFKLWKNNVLLQRYAFFIK